MKINASFHFHSAMTSRELTAEALWVRRPKKIMKKIRIRIRRKNGAQVYNDVFMFAFNVPLILAEMSVMQI